MYDTRNIQLDSFNNHKIYFIVLFYFCNVLKLNDLPQSNNKKNLKIIRHVIHHELDQFSIFRYSLQK